MENVGTFPFGWIRGYNEDNWQIFWDPESSVIFLKGAMSGEMITFDKADSWKDARDKTQRILESPEILETLFG